MCDLQKTKDVSSLISDLQKVIERLLTVIYCPQNIPYYSTSSEISYDIIILTPYNKVCKKERFIYNQSRDSCYALTSLNLE